NIRRDAAIELDKIVVILKDNPKIVIVLGSHTDSRGSDAYNEILSQRRAQSAVDYIVKIGGISQDRISAKGYGETILVNRCKNDIPCSAAEHQQNRRTEFKVVSH
ncbi:MAG: OmpA family protein, partial [Bacteroidota bacterium]